jgi:hypothetical protein
MGASKTLVLVVNIAACSIEEKIERQRAGKALLLVVNMATGSTEEKMVRMGQAKLHY